MTAGPKLVEGGPDHGTMWKDICLPPTADPETVAHVLRSSFNDEWIRELVKTLLPNICEICGDPRCTGAGVPDDPLDCTHASGQCICDICGQEFRAHPGAKDLPGYDGCSYLTRLCDGRLVKL